MSSDALDLPLQSLIDRLPMAAYAVRAPDGVIAWYNEKAAELWGRRPKNLSVNSDSLPPANQGSG